jgi:GNAT superfamily N-acetyltransferase
MSIVIRRVDEVSSAERTSIDALRRSVYSPEDVANWAGRHLEWSDPHWRVITWDPNQQAVSYLGALVREAEAGGRGVRIGGIGGVMTHPAHRRQGLARAAIGRAIELFAENSVDFALLVCTPELIPLYERLGWQVHRGTLQVRQHGRSEAFTFNVPLTKSVLAERPDGGVIDLLGPPW